MLLSEPPAPLTVAEVSRRAGVPRTSFYFHYASVADLVASTLAEEMSAWLVLPEADVLGSAGTAAGATGRLLDLFGAGFARLAPDRPLYNAGFHSEGGALLRSRLHLAIAAQVRHLIDAWRASGHPVEIESDVVVAFSTAGLVGALEAWCDAPEVDADPSRWLRGLAQTLPMWWPDRSTEYREVR